jgi:hypothetical protein
MVRRLAAWTSERIDRVFDIQVWERHLDVVAGAALAFTSVVLFWLLGMDGDALKILLFVIVAEILTAAMLILL